MIELSAWARVSPAEAPVVALVRFTLMFAPELLVKLRVSEPPAAGGT